MHRTIFLLSYGMDFTAPLMQGQFIKRYKRFFVDVELPNGEIITAHCPNTGSMKGLLDPSHTAYVSSNDDPKRKLKYTLELIGTPYSLVGVHTGRPNYIVQEAIEQGQVPELANYATIKPEQKYGTNSRIDLLLTDPDQPDCYVEVKNTTLREDDAATFPDAITTRGQKHLDELTEMVAQGNRAVMFYLVNRGDCNYFAPADDIDATYGIKLRNFLKAGGEALAYACDISPEGIKVANKLGIKI